MNILDMLKSSINIIYAKYLGKEEIEELPIYYIGGSQVLPPPLTPEEEEEQLRRTCKRKSRSKKNISREKFKTSSIHSQKIWEYRSRHRRPNINRNNWTYESNKHIWHRQTN